MEMTILKPTNEWLNMSKMGSKEKLQKIKETLQDLNVPEKFTLAATMKKYLLNATDCDAECLRSYLMKSDGLKTTKEGHRYMLEGLMLHKNTTVDWMIMDNGNRVPTSENPATNENVIVALNAIEVFDICIAVMLWDYEY